MEHAPVKAIEHGGTEVELAQVHPPTAVPTEQLPKTASMKRLPKTASPLPLLGLVGIVFLAAGFGARSLSKKIL